MRQVRYEVAGVPELTQDGFEREASSGGAVAEGASRRGDYDVREGEHIEVHRGFEPAGASRVRVDLSYLGRDGLIRGPVAGDLTGWTYVR